MKKIFLYLLLISGAANAQETSALLENGVRQPVYQIAPVENPSGLTYFSTYLKRLDADSISNVGFASYGNSVSGPWAVALLNQLRKYNYYKMLTYPSSYNSVLTVASFNGTHRYADSAINQATAKGSPSDFTYISSGDHFTLAVDDSMVLNTSLQVGFDMFRVYFATTSTSGNVTVNIRDAVNDTLIRTSSLNLNSATIGCRKIQFTGLPEQLRMKASIICTSDSVQCLKIAFMYSKKALIPLQLGRGGSTLANNMYANRAVMDSLMTDFNIRFILVSAKEESPRTSYPALVDTFNRYPGVSKLFLGSLPDAANQDSQIVWNNIGAKLTLAAGWAQLNAYRAFNGYTGLSSIGAQGDGTHPTPPPYEAIMGRVVTQAGWDQMSTTYRGNVDNTDLANAAFVKTNELYIMGPVPTYGTFRQMPRLVARSASSPNPRTVDLLNIHEVIFDSTASGIRWAKYGTEGIAIQGGSLRVYANSHRSLPSSTEFSSLYGLQLTSGTDINISALSTTAANFNYRSSNSTQALRVLASNGNVGIDVAAPTAKLHLPAGTTTSGTAPIKFTSGALLTTGEAGAWNYDGTHFYAVPSGTTWKKIPIVNNATASNGLLPIGNGTDFTLAAITEGVGIKITNASGSITAAVDTNVIATKAATITQTSTLDFPSIAANTSEELTMTVTGAALGDVVLVTKQGGFFYDAAIMMAWGSGTNTVTVRILNAGTAPFDPASDNYKVKVFK